MALRLLDPDSDGAFTLYPCDQSPVGHPRELVFAGSAAWLTDIAELNSRGEVCLHTTATVHFVVDVMGFISG